MQWFQVLYHATRAHTECHELRKALHFELTAHSDGWKVKRTVAARDESAPPKNCYIS